MKTKRSLAGFTLIEILVVMMVFGLLMGGILSFYLQSMKSMYASDQRMKLAGQINRFSNELIVQASRSNQFILFKSASPGDFDGPNLAPDSGNSDRQNIVNTGGVPLHPAGDFVVFVYYEIPKPITDPITLYHRVKKIEGYFLDTSTPGGIGTVKKVVIDLSAAPSTSTVENILSTKWNTSAAKFSNYFHLVRGLAVPEVVDGTEVLAGAPAPTPRLFYMSAVRNVIISGQIYTSNARIMTNDWKTYTNSFCFNITPRT